MLYRNQHALLCVGELTTTYNPGPQHTLQISDVNIVSQNSTPSLSICMHSYKHSGHTPKTLQIVPQSGILCPVDAYRKYVNIRGNAKGPLFIFPDGTPVTRVYFITQFNIALRWAKLDPKLYKGHILIVI